MLFNLHFTHFTKKESIRMLGFTLPYNNLAKFTENVEKMVTVLLHFIKNICAIVSKMPDSLQQDSTKCAPHYKLNSSVTMTTYWVPDLPNIKDISGHLWRSIFMFANDA